MVKVIGFLEDHHPNVKALIILSASHGIFAFIDDHTEMSAVTGQQQKQPMECHLDITHMSTCQINFKCQDNYALYSVK